MPAADQPRIEVLLFVAGQSATGRRAARTIRQVVTDAQIALDLRVIDVLEQPEQAEIHRVLATPTVIRVLPTPQVRVVGDLGEGDDLLTVADRLLGHHGSH